MTRKFCVFTLLVLLTTLLASCGPKVPVETVPTITVKMRSSLAIFFVPSYKGETFAWEVTTTSDHEGFKPLIFQFYMEKTFEFGFEPEEDSGWRLPNPLEEAHLIKTICRELEENPSLRPEYGKPLPRGCTLGFLAEGEMFFMSDEVTHSSRTTVGLILVKNVPVEE